jgi:hypothetical protein
VGGPTADDQARATLVAALALEMAWARVRGLDRLERAPGAQHPIATPQLERLARAYSGDYQAGRIQLIRQLLDAALTAWARNASDADASFLRGLYFAADGSTPGELSTDGLLAAVQTASGRSDHSFVKHRQDVMRRFAAYLIDFVSHRRGAPSPAVPEAPPHSAVVAAAERAALIGPWRWSLADLAFMVATVALTVVMVVNPAGPAGHGAGAPFRFDALGGGSSIVNVYPGVQDTAADRQPNGTFASGQTTTAVCKTTGRTVRSDPNVGERPRESDIWIRVVGTPGLKQDAP